MQINGIGKLHADGETLAEVEFTLVTTPGFPAGRGELRCETPALHEAYGATEASLFLNDLAIPVPIMIVGAPDGSTADFVTLGVAPRDWSV
ncbi:hypothetical protein ASC89_15785 [Devosia sp. Root413D1]|uniref:hypothetical protein n=1 Tax=Devosia sp. Root413D1 TaxID=1736531 RepID=UPI0006F24540|nr:hypothetical protein [Devosia sp. Root413D1]KQW78249.1 hypothetical protein ASC89_15785 [Devosia sp. Root413D1]